jgi:hypothetical protein
LSWEAWNQINLADGTTAVQLKWEGLKGKRKQKRLTVLMLLLLQVSHRGYSFRFVLRTLKRGAEISGSTRLQMPVFSENLESFKDTSPSREARGRKLWLFVLNN